MSSIVWVREDRSSISADAHQARGFLMFLYDKEVSNLTFYIYKPSNQVIRFPALSCFSVPLLSVMFAPSGA